MVTYIISSLVFATIGFVVVYSIVIRQKPKK